MMQHAERLTATTREVTNEFLRRLGGDDAASTAALFADRVDYLCAGSESVPWIRPRQTRDDMEALFATLSDAFVPEDRSVWLSVILVEGDDAVIMGTVSQRLRSNGIAFASPFALRLTVQGGRIVRYHLYEDSLAVASAVAGQSRVITSLA